MKKLYLKPIRDLKQMGKRGIVVILILGLCIGFVLSMFFMSTDILPVFRGFYEDANAADYTYETSGFNSSFIDEITDVDGVDDIQARLVVQYPLEIEGREETLQIRLVGVDVTEDFDDTHNLDIYSYEIKDGKNLEPDDELSIILSRRFVENNDEIEVGDDLTVGALGDTEFNIKGSFFSMEYVMVNTLPEVLFPVHGTMGVALLNRTVLQDLINTHRPNDFEPYTDFNYNELHVTFQEGFDAESVNEEIEDVFKDSGIIRKSSTPFEESYAWRMMEADLEGSAEFMAVFMVLALIMAFTSCLSIFMRFAINQKQQMGTLSSLGYRKKDIYKSFFVLVLLISVIASVIGALFGYLMMVGTFIEFASEFLGVMYFYPFEFKFFWGSFVLCMGLALISIFPAIRKLLKRDMSDLLYKKEKLYSRMSHKKRTSKRKASTKIVLRNLFRHPKKSFLNLIGIGFSLLIVASSLVMVTSVDYTVNEKIYETETWDASIELSSAVEFDDEIITKIEDIDDIAKLDYVLKSPVIMENPEKDEMDELNTHVLGLYRNFSMHEYELVEFKGEESRLFETDDEVVVCLTIMNRMELEIGQMINFTTPMGQEEEFQIVGVSDEIMAISYINLDALGEFMDKEGKINNLYVQFESGLSREKRKEIISDIYDVDDNVMLVQDIEDMVDDISSYADMLIPFMGILIAFASIVAFFILYNATLMSIGDHESEYGILRSLGYKKRNIYKTIISENLLPLLVSIVISLVLTPFVGTWLLSLYEDYFALSLFIPSWVYIATLVIPVLVILWAGRSGMKYIYSRNLYKQVQTEYIG
ncbi:MAG: ABC transporter permease [Promethearchaeia archaeon]